MRKEISQLGLAILVSLAGTGIHADEVSDQIESGLKAYVDKDYKLALDELKFAEAQLQEMVNKENEMLLPKAPDGWKAGDAKTTSMAMLGGGGIMSREYTKGKQKMKIEIAANSPMLGIMTMMMKNPMMMAANDKMKPYRYKRQKGMIEMKNGRMETKLVLAGQILLSMTLSDNDKARLKESGKKTTEMFLDGMSISKIKEAFLE